SGAVERLDPERPLVIAMQRMVPGEAHAAVHLDRALACHDRGLRRVRLRRDRGKLGLTVILGDAPRGPVRERARELGLHVGVRELVRDRLVRADRPAELLAAFGVLDTEGERLAGDADRLEGERRERAPPSGGDDLRGGGRCREEAGVVVSEGDAAEPPRYGDRVEDADLRPGAMALCPGRAVPAILRRRDLREARKGVTLLEKRAGLRAELVLFRREAEVHQRLLGRPRTRSAMMFRRISDVPASMVFPLLRSC